MARKTVSIAVEALAGHRLHDLLDLGGDDVAADELRVVENLADQSLGEDVLDEHLIDGGLREIRVETRLAQLEERGERFLECRVRLVRLCDLFREAFGKV